MRSLILSLCLLTLVNGCQRSGLSVPPGLEHDPVWTGKDSKVGDDAGGAVSNTPTIIPKNVLLEEYLDQFDLRLDSIFSRGRTPNIFENNCSFNAIDGLHEGKIIEDLYSLKMKDVSKIEKFNDYFTLDTGSPHCVKFCDNLNGLDVNLEGREIRNNKFFRQEGINVNFVDTDNFSIRTYERGVEEETEGIGGGERGETGTDVAGGVGDVLFRD